MHRVARANGFTSKRPHKCLWWYLLHWFFQSGPRYLRAPRVIHPPTSKWTKTTFSLQSLAPQLFHSCPHNVIDSPPQYYCSSFCKKAVLRNTNRLRSWSSNSSVAIMFKGVIWNCTELKNTNNCPSQLFCKMQNAVCLLNAICKILSANSIYTKKPKIIRKMLFAKFKM